MKYEKPPRSFAQQAVILISRGLIADRSFLIDTLKRVNYYRLSGYLYPFRLSDDSFNQDITFEKIWKIYRFDRLLRLILLDGIERVEIAARTQISFLFADRFGPFEYSNNSAFPRFRSMDDHHKWLSDLKRELNRSREDFIVHFKEKYGDNHILPPIWMVTEIFTFGRLLTMYSGVHDQIRKDTASYFKTEDAVLESWFRALNGVRNISAHHGRLWNRILGYKPLLPNKRKHPEWHADASVSNSRLFVIVLVLRHLLRICAPASQWPTRVENLIDEFPEIPLQKMGFPDGWKKHSVWI
jgi:abortive infection bacteriophage resistance protein